MRDIDRMKEKKPPKKRRDFFFEARILTIQTSVQKSGYHCNTKPRRCSDAAFCNYGYAAGENHVQSFRAVSGISGRRRIIHGTDTDTGQPPDHNKDSNNCKNIPEGSQHSAARRHLAVDFFQLLRNGILPMIRDRDRAEQVRYIDFINFSQPRYCLCIWDGYSFFPF